MDAQTQISCPICRTSIPINIDNLIKGEKFTCPHCGTVIGLSGNNLERVSEAMKKMENMKKIEEMRK